MFTGIVEEMGEVVSLTRNETVKQWDGSVSEGWVLVVRARVVLEGAYEGCSIAVNGTCLTAVTYDADTFTVGCAPETMRCTNLGDLISGSAVNLERPLAAGARNSGHFVQGHVDGAGSIEKMWREGDSLWVRVKVAHQLIKYIVPKGYVAIDGTSLTVCEVDVATGCFTFMLIAYTQTRIIVARKKEGERVNVEVDVLGKLVEASGAGLAAAVSRVESKVDEALARMNTRLESIEARLASAEKK